MTNKLNLRNILPTELIMFIVTCFMSHNTKYG